MQISASILSLEQDNITKKLYNLEVANIDYFHIDVMDGKFVKNNTSEVMKENSLIIKHISQTPLDVHLMVEDIAYYINEYLDLKPKYITFHYEVDKNKEKLIEKIKYIQKYGSMAGISIKPNTDIKEVLEILPYISLILVMSVEPGEGGQEFMANSIGKIKELREYIDKNNLEVQIEVDGGINSETIKLIKEAGADIAVVGSYLVKSDDYKETVMKLKK